MVTLFSAPNYCDSYQNKGAVLLIESKPTTRWQMLCYDWVKHPYVLPKFENALAWSIPIFGESLRTLALWGHTMLNESDSDEEELDGADDEDLFDEDEDEELADEAVVPPDVPGTENETSPTGSLEGSVPRIGSISRDSILSVGSRASLLKLDRQISGKRDSAASADLISSHPRLQSVSQLMHTSSRESFVCASPHPKKAQEVMLDLLGEINEINAQRAAMLSTGTLMQGHNQQMQKRHSIDGFDDELPVAGTPPPASPRPVDPQPRQARKSVEKRLSSFFEQGRPLIDDLVGRNILLKEDVSDSAQAQAQALSGAGSVRDKMEIVSSIKELAKASATDARKTMFSMASQVDADNEKMPTLDGLQWSSVESDGKRFSAKLQWSSVAVEAKGEAAPARSVSSHGLSGRKNKQEANLQPLSWSPCESESSSSSQSVRKGLK